MSAKDESGNPAHRRRNPSAGAIRTALNLGLVLLATAALTELLLNPAPGKRVAFAKVFVAPVVIGAVTIPLLARWVASRRTIVAGTLFVAFSSMTVGAVSSAVASREMFVTGKDFKLFMIFVFLESGIAIAVAQRLNEPMAKDIRRLESVASAVARGVLSERTQIERRDELGNAAHAIDQMVDSLAGAAAEREVLTRAQQRLLSSVSHDLRTPLAASRAALECVRDGLAPDPDRYIAIAEKHLFTIEQLLDQLHTFARVESGQFSQSREPLSLAELADETTEALQPLAQLSRVSLKAVTDGPAMVWADATEISRVLRNLVENAIRHSPESGRVAVTLCQETERVRLTVTDQGEGFPSGFKAIAFEPFTRADPARASGASGLGLAIAKAIVENHGGTIAIAEGPIAEGSGGTIELVLPRYIARLSAS